MTSVAPLRALGPPPARGRKAVSGPDEAPSFALTCRARRDAVWADGKRFRTSNAAIGLIGLETEFSPGVRSFDEMSLSLLSSEILCFKNSPENCLLF